MKDGVILRGNGGTLTYTIQPLILDSLGLEWKDPVEFDVINEDGDILMTLTRPLRKMGRGSMGVSIRFYVAMKLNLKANDVIQVDIRKGEK